VVHAGIEAQAIPQLEGYHELVPEMPLGENSRADFCLRVHRDDMVARCWVEVKAVTLARGRTALFPDAVTERGRKHLAELAQRVQRGDRAVQLFFLQRGDCDSFQVAAGIDPAYAQALRGAAAAGVEVLAVAAKVSKRGIEIERQVPVEL
jgi:sugar fermentation stimulation protein A